MKRGEAGNSPSSEKLHGANGTNGQKEHGSTRLGFISPQKRGNELRNCDSGSN